MSTALVRLKEKIARTRIPDELTKPPKALLSVLSVTEVGVFPGILPSAPTPAVLQSRLRLTRPSGRRLRSSWVACQ